MAFTLSITLNGIQINSDQRHLDKLQKLCYTVLNFFVTHQDAKANVDCLIELFFTYLYTAPIVLGNLFVCVWLFGFAL